MRNLKRVLSLALAALMLMGMMVVGAGAASKDFTDADEIKNVEAVDVMVALGVLEGGDKGDFQPNSILTREQAAKIICYMLLGEEAAEKLTTNYSIFSDVPANRWSAPYISYCVNLGILAGDGNGHFFPEGKLTGVAFAKMLMVCLGYNAERENYVGNNWEINTSAAAIAAGVAPKALDLSKELSRQDAAQMAFNTLSASMVEYNNDNTIIIGGQTIVSTTGKATAVAQSPYVDTMNSENLQFAEKYFPKLKKVADTDAFGRPAYTWNYNSEDVGTYVDYSLMVKEDTTSVKYNEVYDVLGSTVLKNSDLVVYVDGVVRTDVIDKNDIARSNKVSMGGTGNGVLTQVFYNDDANEITIVEMNTYLATATSDYNAKTDKVNLTVYGYDKTNKKLDTTKTAPYTGITSEDIAAAADCKSGDFLLVTIADGVLQTIATPESETDVAMTSFKKGTSVGNAETTYTFAESLAYDNTILNAWDDSNMANATYNVYMDQYGYLIGIELYKESDNYVFITGYDYSTSSIAASTVTATGIFVDGSMKTIKVNAEKGAGATFTADGGNPVVNWWYTYSVNSDGVYTLGTASNQVWDKTHDIKSAKVGLNNTDTSSRYYYGNNDTNYILVDQNSGLKTLNSKDAIYKIQATISGVKNVNIDVATTADSLDSYGSHAIYNSKGYIIAAVVVGENLGLTQNYAYVTKGNPEVENIHSDSEGYWYWDFQVITKDEGITTKTVKGEYNTLTSIIPANGKGLYTFTYDADGYVVDADPVTADISDPSAIVPGTTGDMKYTTTTVLNTDGETMYGMVGSSLMRGFALAAGYKIYTVETLNGSVVAQDWNGDAIAAVSSLALNNASTSKDVYALFNSNGEATTVIIVIDQNYNSNQGGNWGNTGKMTLNGLTFSASGIQLNITNKSGATMDTSDAYNIVVKNADGNQVYAGAATNISGSIADGNSGVLTFGGFTSVPSNTGNYTVTLTVKTAGGDTYTTTAVLGTV